MKKFSAAFRSSVAALLLVALAVPAAAQFAPPGYGAESPSTALGRYLRAIVASPRNLDALRGAGRAALELGDLDAAVGFLARAEEVSPRDGRTKAGLGSAFTMLQQPGAALRYFDDAVDLGVPAIDVARDRGLAYDLRGNTRAAQREYKLVLASRPDSEATRRLAVSQAAGGDTATALATLEPQVRAGNATALRLRAFVMAMGGDTVGAQRVAAAVLPAATANAFAPYFQRMAGLSPAQKVAAAQFGSVPGEARTIRMADLMSEGERAARVALESVRVAPPRSEDAGRPDAGQVALGQIAPRRGGDGVPLPVTSSGGRVAGTLVPTRVAEAPRAPVAQVALPVTTRSAVTTPPPLFDPSTGLPTEVAPARTPVPIAGPVSTATAGVSSDPRSSPVLDEAPVQATPAPLDMPSGDSAIVTTLVAPPASSPPLETPVTVVAPPPPRPKVERPVARTAAALRSAAADDAPTKPEPTVSRHYVQVGIGQDRAALGADWRRLRTRHAGLLGGQDAWTAPLNKTNRLLVGPFPTAGAAQAFVNKLAEGDVSATRYASEPGQAISALR